MRFDVTLRIARKELGLLFSSPIAYLFLAAFLAVTLFVFFWGEAFFARNISDVRPMFEWLPLLLIFLASALTMRMWSDERRGGTLELVVTVPASSAEFVVGKFLACWALLGIALLLTLPLPASVALLGDLDWGPVFAGYLAAALLGAAYLGIGLFVSAKTDNQMVALILAAFGCGVFYLIGSPFLVELVSNQVADALRAIGAGSRFESITRGVLDLRDLYFYASVLAVFLALNVYAVDAHGWAADGVVRRHTERRIVLGLVAANFLVANLWLSAVNFLRWDVTEGNQYSISDATRGYLRQLREPLLVRGYFSAKTHPLLAPLAPQLQNLLNEYEVAGDGRVRLELIDPATDPEAEDEANTKYGIRPVPFQVADRYQASLVNSYFDVLVQYGDEYEVLSFRDLIEVKVRGEADLDVQLKNPEYEITRAVKKVLYGFQGGGSVFDSLAVPVTFNGYISAAERLPEALAALRVELDAVLAEMTTESNGLLTSALVDPSAGDGEVAQQIAADYGFRPMAASLFDVNTFYFYLTLSDGETVIQLPLPESLDSDGLRRGIEEGLKRFATGLLKAVALSAPQGMPPYMQQQMQMQQPPGNEFQSLREVLSADFDLETALLDGGEAPGQRRRAAGGGPKRSGREVGVRHRPVPHAWWHGSDRRRQLPGDVDPAIAVRHAGEDRPRGLAGTPRGDRRRILRDGSAECGVSSAGGARSGRLSLPRHADARLPLLHRRARRGLEPGSAIYVADAAADGRVGVAGRCRPKRDRAGGDDAGGQFRRQLALHVHGHHAESGCQRRCGLRAGRRSGQPGLGGIAGRALRILL